MQLIERIAMFWGLGYQIVDDLKDVLQGAEDSGKTAARDVLLDRSNTVVAMGAGGAVQRLMRFIDLGDKALYDLMRSQGGLSFLGRLRSELEEELARVTGDA